MFVPMTTTELHVVTLKTTYSNWSQTHTLTLKIFIDECTRWFGSVNFFPLKFSFVLMIFSISTYVILLNFYWPLLNFNCCSALCLVSTGRWLNGNTPRWKEAWAAVHPMRAQHSKDSKTFQCRESLQHSHSNHPPYERTVEYPGQLFGAGSGRIIFKALDEPYKAYFPHTFGLKSADFLFGLM